MQNYIVEIQVTASNFKVVHILAETKKDASLEGKKFGIVISVNLVNNN